jgi:hypothetical protein
MRRWIPGLVLVAVLSGTSLRASGANGAPDTEDWCTEPDVVDGEPDCPAPEDVLEEAEASGDCPVTSIDGGLLYEDRGCCYVVERLCPGGCY